MAEGDAILGLAWIGAVAGPVFILLLVRRLLRGGRRFLAGGAGLLGALFWALGVWAFLIEPATLTVRRVTVASPTWTGPPLRIGLISDVHVGLGATDVARVQAIVERMNGERPDIVLLLGDYTGGKRPAGARPPAVRAEVLDGVGALGGLRSPLGVYAVIGNHDVWFDEDEIAGRLRAAGIEVLVNRAVEVRRPHGTFWIGGLADVVSRHAAPSPQQTLRDVPPTAPVVMISHWPDPFDAVPARVALTLAGHTHCGQVRLPVIGRPALPSPGSRRWPCGLYDEDGRRLFVTGGTGMSVVPARFGAPPEIVVLTLHAPD